MNSILQTLNQMESISLQEIEAISLLNRQDSKYAFTRDQLQMVLEKTPEYYRVLDPSTGRLVSYYNRYFDTPEYKMYLDHQRGKRNRCKFRYRQYRESGLTFFEIKFKNNKKRTIKSRVQVDNIRNDLNLPAVVDLLSNTPYGPNELDPMLDIEFSRFTLVNKQMNDRCTIDTGLVMKNKNKQVEFPELVICEVKQAKQSRNNELIRIFEELHIAPLNLSKYCLGMLELYPGIKYNRFKEKLLRLKRLTPTYHA